MSTDMKNSPFSHQNILPTQLIQMLKTIFNILDDGNKGYIFLSDIERLWKGEGLPYLPNNFISFLKKQSLHNRISLDNFLVGIKKAILQSRADEVNQIKLKDFNQNANTNSTDNLSCEPTIPLSSFANPSQKIFKNSSNNISLNKLTQEKNIHLQNESEILFLNNSIKSSIQNNEKNKNLNQKFALNNKENQLNHNVSSDISTVSKKKLLNTEKSLLSSSRSLPQLNPVKTYNNNLDDEFFQKKLPHSLQSSSSTCLTLSSRSGLVTDDVSSRQRGMRRHTLASGIDFNMIKRIRQLEQEKECLFSGLESVKKAYEWYKERIQAAKNLQHSIHSQYDSQQFQSVEANQERISLLSARIRETNRHLESLTTVHDQNVSSNMNLEVSHSESSAEDKKDILRAQNQLLMHQLGEKSNRIAKLEQEKAALVKEVFEARSKFKTSSFNDSSFI